MRRLRAKARPALALLTLVALCWPVAACRAQQEAEAPRADPLLRTGLETATRRLWAALPGGGPVVVIATEGASVLDGYAAAMAVFFLRESGMDAKVGQIEKVAVRPPQVPDRLAGIRLPILRRGGATSAVLVRVAPDGGSCGLHAAAYSLHDGRKVVGTRLTGLLCDETAGLAEARRGELPRADRQWLEVLRRVFPPCGWSPHRPETRRAHAEGVYFFRSGLWELAAARLRLVHKGEPDVCLVRIVMSLGQAGRKREALRLVETALQSHPDSGPLYALKAWIRLRQGAEGDAVVLLQQARIYDLHRRDRLAYYLLVRHLMALEADETETARQRVREAAELVPEDPFPQLEAARFFWREAELQEAVEFYRRALHAGADSSEAWADLGMTLYAAGRTKEAEDALRYALRLEPGHARAARNLASLLESEGRQEDALEVLREASAARPDRVELLAACGDTAARMWLTAEAQRAYELSVARDPEFHYGKVGLARMLARRRRFEEARQMLAGLLEAHPDCHAARLALGEIMARSSETERARELLAQSAKVPGYEVSARLAMADVLRRAGRHSEAERNAQIAVEARSLPECYAMLARVYLAAGQRDRAEAAVEKALEVAPGACVAHLAAAELAREQERWQEALTSAEQAIKLDRFSFEAHVMSGRLHLQLGNPAKCAELWERALNLNPWDVELHWDLAELLRTELGDGPGAVRHYARHVELRGTHADEAQRLLSERTAPEPKR